MLYPHNPRLSFKLVFIFIVLFVFGIAPAFASTDCFEEPNQVSSWPLDTPDSIEVGYFMGTDSQDFVVADQTDAGDLIMYINRRNGTYERKCIIGSRYDNCTYVDAELDPPLIVQGLGSQTMAAGDLNGDGYDDLVIVGQYRKNWIMYNKADNEAGGRTFTLPEEFSFEYAFSVQLKDLNFDGHLDIVFGKGIDGWASLAVLLNNGSGKFDQEPTYYKVMKTPVYGKAAIHIALADLIGDKAFDAVVVNTDKQFNHGGAYDAGGIIQGTIYGTFLEGQTRSFGLKENVDTVAVGDLNLDGRNDIVVGATYTDYSSQLGMLFNTGIPGQEFDQLQTFWLPLPQPTSKKGKITSLHVADLDGDLDPDVVVDRDITGDQLAVYNCLIGDYSVETLGEEISSSRITKAHSDDRESVLSMQDDFDVFLLERKMSCSQ